MVAQFFDGLRRAKAGQVGGGGDGYPAQGRQGPGNQALVLDLAGAQQRIETLVDNIHQAVGHHCFDAQIGVAQGQLTNHGHHHLAPEQRRGANFQQTGRCAAAIEHELFGFGQLGQQRCAAFIQHLAIRGQADAAGVALQQAYSQLGFQARDSAGQARLREPQVSSSAGETAGFGDAYQQAKGVQVHD